MNQEGSIIVQWMYVCIAAQHDAPKRTSNIRGIRKSTGVNHEKKSINHEETAKQVRAER
jgi:hypothetical protein